MDKKFIVKNQNWVVLILSLPLFIVGVIGILCAIFANMNANYIFLIAGLLSIIFGVIVLTRFCYTIEIEENTIKYRKMHPVK